MKMGLQPCWAHCTQIPGLDGCMLEVSGRDGCVCGTEGEHIRAARGAQQTFELLIGQEGTGLGVVAQVPGHLSHVSRHGLALEGCGQACRVRAGI